MDPATIAISITGSIVSGITSAGIVAGISTTASRLAKPATTKIKKAEEKANHNKATEQLTAMHDTSDA